MTTLALDAMGSDHGAQVTVAGRADDSAPEGPRVVLVGDGKALKVLVVVIRDGLREAGRT